MGKKGREEGKRGREEGREKERVKEGRLDFLPLGKGKGKA